ncbi:hypothetical protein [Paenibacillus alkalitolerans]|uniref:hypothetical protein n=1 Tax=Paenibacillus alkalitolerans TaxID=2799335 RepID=UPI0018F5293A|nr:hypothetical protein [Paenibacillus alkalitolerans]
MEWIEYFEQAVRKNNINRMLDILQQHATSHAGTPNQAVKNKALSVIRGFYRADETGMFSLAVRLSSSGNATGEQLSTVMFAECYTIHPEEANHQLHGLADKSNWEVREWAASACGIASTFRFLLPCYGRLGERSVS